MALDLELDVAGDRRLRVSARTSRTFIDRLFKVNLD